MRKRKVAVLQDADGKWCIDFTDEFGKRRRQRVGPDEATARAAARAKGRELNDTIARESNPATASVPTVLRAFFEGDKTFDTAGLLNRVGPLTASKYRTIHNHFKAFFPAQVTAFHELSRYHVELYLTTRVNEGAAPKTILAEFVVLRSLCRWAAAEHADNGKHYLLKYDITTGVRPPKLAVKLPVYYEPAELTKLFAAARQEPMIRAMVCLGYYHGLRTSSIARLKVADVVQDAAGWKFKVWTKHGGEVAFNLHPEAAAALRECVPTGAGAYWFGDEWAAKPGMLSQWLCAWIRGVLGVGKRFHDLRHTTAHAHVVAGTPAPVLQQVLGHASLATTQNYVRLWQHEVADAARRLPVVGEK